MGKIALSIVQSVDGYIADLDDQFDFIEGVAGPNLTDVSTSDSPYSLEAFFEAYDIIVMGHPSLIKLALQLIFHQKPYTS